VSGRAGRARSLPRGPAAGALAFPCSPRTTPPLSALAALSRSNLCAIHAKRVTIMVKDIWLARRIRGLHDFGGWVM
jgi:hypothetical protein